MPNPNHDPAHPIPAVPASIPNRGIALPMFKEISLRQLRFYRHYLRRVQREWDPAHATPERLQQLWEARFQLEKDQKETPPEAPVPIVKVSDFRRTYENLLDTFNNTVGTGGSPLSYVVRIAVDPPIGDLGYGSPTFHAELTRRTPHSGPHWDIDNKAVWKIVRQVCHGSPAWPWISGFEGAQDGRGAVLALRSHYMGNSYVQTTATQADAKLATLRYDGKSQNFPWETFSSAYIQAFIDLAENNEPVPEAKKVRLLLDAVRDPALTAAKAAIRGDTTKSGNFLVALNYLTEVHAVEHKNDTRSRSRNISTVQSQRGRSGGRGWRGRGRGGFRGTKPGRGGGRGRGSSQNQKAKSPFDASNPGKGYSAKEWKSLSGKERSKVLAARAGRTGNASRNAAALQSDRQGEAATAGVGSQMSRRPARDGA